MSERALEIKRRLKAGEIVYAAWQTFNDCRVAGGAGLKVKPACERPRE